jgi:hypothetical protein
MMQQDIHNPSLPDVSLATAELILSIQAEFPQAKIKSMPPLDDEEVNLEVWLPMPLEQRLSVQHRLAELAGQMMDKYGVYSVALALPLDDSSNANPT